MASWIEILKRANSRTRGSAALEEQTPSPGSSAPVVPIQEANGPLIEDSVGFGLAFGAAGVGIDPDDHLYRKITASQRELPPIIQDRALRLVWTLYESNPFAHGIIEVMKDHIVGKGFAARSAEEDVQEVIDRHWNDDQNLWDLKQHDRVRDLSLYGEGLYLAFVNEADGHVRIAGLDPIWIRSIYTAVDNLEDIQTIVVNPRRKTGGLADSDMFYRVIHEDMDANSPTLGKLIGVKPGETFTPPGGRKVYQYSGSCFYFAINKVTGAIRGRSDIMSVIDWLDAYDQILFNFVDRTLLMNAFMWDVTLQGATQQQILNWRQRHALAPKPGTVNVHNEQEKWEEVSPKVQSTTADVGERTVKTQVLNAVGLPPHWFGELLGARANAAEMSAPAIRRLEARQLYIKYMIEYILRFQIDQAVIAGTLAEPTITKDENGHATKPNAKRFNVVVPKISNKDISQASASMMHVTQALTIAVNNGIIDLPEAQRVFITLIVELGGDIDQEIMDKRMGLDAETGEMSPELTAKLAPKIGNDGAGNQLGASNDTKRDPTMSLSGVDGHGRAANFHGEEGKIVVITNLEEALDYIEDLGVVFDRVQILELANGHDGDDDGDIPGHGNTRDLERSSTP